MRRSKPPIDIEELATYKRALTMADLCNILCVHKLTLYRMARDGRIPGTFRVGACLRFKPQDIAKWIETL